MVHPIPQLEFKKPRTPGSELFEIVDLEYLIHHKPLPEDHNPYRLHRLNFFAVLINTAPKVSHQIDFTKVALNKDQIVVIAKGQTHCFDPKNRYSGYLIVFTEEFLQQQLQPATMSGIKMLYQQYGAPFTYQFDETLKQVVANFQRELSQENSYTQEMLGAMLTIFLLSLQRQHASTQTAVQQSEFYAKFIRFKTLVEEHFHESRDAVYYAKKLNITYKYLNEITRKSIGKTAKAFIDDTLLLEAKRLLIASSMRAKEVGFACGFEDPTNFVKFFKKHIGQTPKSFQLQNKG